MFNKQLLLGLILAGCLCSSAIQAQDCPAAGFDANGDLSIGSADLVEFLTVFGQNLDQDADGIIDCEDPCIGNSIDCSFTCGDSIDFFGYAYQTVLIGNQCWFAENLRTDVYSNGDLIPASLNDDEWTSTTSGATTVYGEGSSTCMNSHPLIDACDEAQSLAEFGRLYNGYAISDARGLCPSGWHVPNNLDWKQLENFITSQGFSGTVGTALKSTSGWITNNYDPYGGTDDFGFTGLPGAYRASNSGSFFSAGYTGVWWSSIFYNGEAFTRILTEFSNIYTGLDNPTHGASVRCLMDIPGCTHPAYLEYNAEANLDDGSCVTLVTSCENVVMDGHSYETVLIGEQCWFAENLRTTRYANGDIILSGLDDSEWNSTTSGANAIYGEGSSNCYSGSPEIDACNESQSLEACGRLYNWYAVDDSRGLCPSGWHVPLDQEWTELEDYITTQLVDGIEGEALKATTGWAEPSQYNYEGGNGTDYFGFSAFPCGRRSTGFFEAGLSGTWWSSTPYVGNAWSRGLDHNSNLVLQGDLSMDSGRSVRCIKD